MLLSSENLLNPRFAALVRDRIGSQVVVGSQVVAFLIVGGVGAAAFIALSSIFVGMHAALPKWLVSTICYAVLIGPVYLAHRRFSFRSDTPHGHALPRYVGVQLCALLLASIFSYVAYNVFGLPAVWASILVTGMISAVNFVVLRLWAFAPATSWTGGTSA